VKLLTFKKGVHPDDYKSLTNSKSISEIPLPEEVFIPLQQHIGAPCQALVEKGAEVKTGQVIGRSESYVSAPVHSSVTGKVKAVADFMHPAGIKTQMIHIKRTGDDEWESLTTPEDWKTATVEELKKLIWDAGIVGLGGAAFPTHVKLSPPAEKPIDSLILNGCECEPYLTSDHRTMVEDAEKVLTGMEILFKVLGAKKGYIGIENNKPDAIQIMDQKVKDMGLDFKVVPLHVKYPQGAEKMLIDAVLKRKVPTGGLPMDVGVVVNNIGTALAVTDAVIEGKPLIERTVTVTGDGIAEPQNVNARIGTTFKYLMDYCGGISEDTANVFMGGPMMGMTQWSLDVPVVKATSGIICDKSEGKQNAEYPCIRCGTCVSVCPMFLVPTSIAKLAEKDQYQQADDLGILNCVECGSCAFGCPSNIPLVQWIRVGKLRVGDMKRKQAS